MVQKNKPITKSEICMLSGVSKTFLYSYHEEILKPINDAIGNQDIGMSLNRKKYTDNSKDKIIESLKRRVAAFEKENKRLKNENEILLGKLAQKK